MREPTGLLVLLALLAGAVTTGTTIAQTPAGITDDPAADDAMAGPPPSAAASFRQSRDEAWWTGPLLAASANTLPKGHFLVEPYFYDAIVYDHLDNDGRRVGTVHEDDFGSLTYILYGLTDTVSVGVIPRFGFRRVRAESPADSGAGRDSSGVGLGDVALQAQYRLTQFREGGWLPTLSLVAAETLPTGKYDRLGTRPRDGFGAGAYTTTLSLYSQYYFWIPNGRILRTRLDLSYSRSSKVLITDVSVYGTSEGFRGHARPGDSFVADSAFEYSVSRNWVLALDVAYEHDANTRVYGADFHASSGASESIAFAPAVEYNWNGNVGVIVGARIIPMGRNTSASITPVAAINIVM